MMMVSIFGLPTIIILQYTPSIKIPKQTKKGAKCQEGCDEKHAEKYSEASPAIIQTEVNELVKQNKTFTWCQPLKRDI